MKRVPILIRHWTAPAGVLLLVTILYGGVLRELFKAWMNEMGASHGMLIPPIAAYVVYIQRDAILAIPPRGDARGLWAVAAACFLYFLGMLGAEFFITRSSLILLLAGVIWTFWGWARLSALKFPLLLLVTMIPLPQLIYKTLTGPLQLLASSAATDAAQALGMSVYRDGNIIHLANTSLGVEEACSGLHSLSALTVGALLVAFLNLSRNWLRLLLLVSSAPIAIAANVLRVAGTAVLADYRAELAMGFYHLFSGWVVFLIAFGMLMLLATALRAVEGRLE